MSEDGCQYLGVKRGQNPGNERIVGGHAAVFVIFRNTCYGFLGGSARSRNERDMGHLEAEFGVQHSKGGLPDV